MCLGYFWDTLILILVLQQQKSARKLYCELLFPYWWYIIVLGGGGVILGLGELFYWNHVDPIFTFGLHSFQCVD